MKAKIKTKSGRLRRHRRIRKKLLGTKQIPRLCIYRSLVNLQAQLIDDISGKVILCVSTLNPEIKKGSPYGGNIKAALSLGEIFAKLAISKGVENVVFDRGGFAYHGRVKAFAEAAKKSGLKF